MTLRRLRHETAPLHERVERTLDLPARLTSLSAYTALLTRFHGFYAPLEDRLAGVGGSEAAGLDFAARRKAHLLRDDLLALGHSPEAVGALPSCPSLPAVGSLAEAFGCLYVLEGSTLGGQFIRREAAARLGLGPGTGCSFFTGYGDRTGAMWKAFGTALTAYTDAHPEAQDTVVNAAAETFTRLDDWVRGGDAQ